MSSQDPTKERGQTKNSTMIPYLKDHRTQDRFREIPHEKLSFTSMNLRTRHNNIVSTTVGTAIHELKSSNEVRFP